MPLPSPFEKSNNDRRWSPSPMKKNEENREVTQSIHECLLYCVRSATSRMKHAVLFFGFIERVQIGKEHQRIATFNPTTV
jgi:hypothetical protein